MINTIKNGFFKVVVPVLASLYLVGCMELGSNKVTPEPKPTLYETYGLPTGQHDLGPNFGRTQQLSVEVTDYDMILNRAVQNSTTVFTTKITPSESKVARFSTVDDTVTTEFDKYKKGGDFLDYKFNPYFLTQLIMADYIDESLEDAAVPNPEVKKVLDTIYKAEPDIDSEFR